MVVLQRRIGEQDGLVLAAQHLLLLPDASEPYDVEALVRTRFPDAVDDGSGALRLGRHLTFTGPLALDAAAAAVAGVPPPWVLSYALDAPHERGDPPFPGTTDPDGLYRAFADGLPVRAERRGIELLVGIARRLGGAVRVRPSGVVLIPDPEASVDVLVHASGWFEPPTLHAAIAATHPDARIATDAQEWQGPPPGTGRRPADEATADLTPEQRAALHARADQVDAETLAGEFVLDAYAIVVDVGPDAADGLVEVLVHAAEGPISALAGLDWADRAITYEVRWAPADEAAALQEDPSQELRAARRRAARVIGDVARAVVEVTDGVPVDDEGFLLDRYAL